MEKNCPYCGASLPDEASFCSYCGEGINRRKRKKPPIFRKTLIGLILLIAFLSMACYMLFRPKIYEGTGQVSYSDSDGSYQLLLNYLMDRYVPLPRMETSAGGETSYRFPCWLYINYKDTGADAGKDFLER